MGEWKEYRLGDVCTISSSKRIFASEYQKAGIPFYRGKEIIEKQNGTSISNELFISEERFNEIKSKYGVPKEGDMLLSSVGTLGVPYIVYDETFYFKDGNLTWFYDYKNINNYFLYYWFLSPKARFLIDTKAIGSTQKALTIETLKKFEILLPSEEIQNRIVAILKSLDDKIEVNRKISENLEQQAQALFKSWFVDFEPFKNGEFVDSELGMIPKGWRVGTLNELGDVIGGSTPSKAKPEYYTNNGIAWLTPKDLSISQRKFTSKGEIDITQEGYESCSTKLMPRGTVLFSSRAPIGYITIAKNDICTNQGFKSVIPTLAGTAFIYCFLKETTQEIENKATGSTFKEASGALMKSLSAIIPTSIVLDEFENLMSPIFKLQEIVEEEISRLASLRDTLLPKLMSGELKVNEL